MKLDYSIQSPEERKAIVEKIIQETPDLTPIYLEILADYLVLCMEKQEKQQKKILTDNRMSTVNKRECSFEGLARSLENGEDGIYNFVHEDKGAFLTPKISITKEDLEDIPPLRQLREAIGQWEIALKKATGRDAYTIKKALIEMRRDQYIIKQAYRKPVVPNKICRGTKNHIPLDDTSYFDENDELMIQGISLMDPVVVSAIMCNYSKLKEDSYDEFEGDMWYLLLAFEDLCDKALEGFPIYQRILEMKIDKKQNEEIRETLIKEFDTPYSQEYISNLWRNKLPKMIATKAKEDFITRYYSSHGKLMKKCTKCGQIKPAHTLFFSKNSASKDSWYSICKCCRNKKKG